MKKNLNVTLNRINREYELMKKNVHPNFFAAPDKCNIFSWNFVLYNFDKYPYKNGVYYGKIELPPEYPTKPPNLYFITPSGRFKVHEKICLSFTGFHPESWSTAWTIENMLVGLISFMYTNEVTTGSVVCSDSKKASFARQSFNFNLNNANFINAFKNQLYQIEEKTLNMEYEYFKDENENTFYKKIMFFVLSIIFVVVSYYFSKFR